MTDTSSDVLSEFRNHALYKFLCDHPVPQGHQPSMTGTTGSPYQGKWYISDKDYPQYLDLLHDYLFVKKLSPMSFVERDLTGALDKVETSYKPILIDLDFKYPLTTNLTRKFTANHIKGFVQQIFDGLNVLFDLSSYESIRMFVSLRPTLSRPHQSAGVKDGIHIQSPDICLTNEKQKALRAWLLESNAVEASFEGTGYSNAVDDIYDAAMVKSQGWYFYGESKASVNPYRLEHVFEYSPATEEVSEADNTYSPRDLMELLSIRFNLTKDDNVVREEVVDQYNALLKRRHTNQQGQVPGQEEARPASTTIQGDAEMQVIVRSMLNSLRGCSPEDMPLIRNLVMECLSEERSDNYNKWVEVGLCLHYLATNTEMSNQLFDLYIDFSKRSSKFSQAIVGQIRRDWERRTRPQSERMLKWGSLNRWARDDNPQRYEELMTNDILEFIALHVMNTHFHVASIMQKMYAETFKASIDSKRTEWFTFVPNEHVWKHINQGVELRAKISNEVVEMLQKAKDLIKRRERGADGELSDMGKKRIGELLKVEKSLYTAGFKDCVMKECAGLFYEQDFMTKMNMNPYLFVCRNGVLDLRAKRPNGDTFVEFRPGVPSDMMSFVAGKEFGISEPIDYVPLDKTNPNYAELMDFWAKIFPRPELQKYVMTLLSSCLEGMNREQCYYTFTGGGGNGKSKIVELMRMVLGEYQTGLAPTALTRKRPDSGAANPDIMSIKSRRFIYLQEPDDKEPLNTSRMKQLSGEDIVEARGLFSDQEKFKLSGKLFMLCNSLPPIHSMDHATWRRVRLVPFESTFVKEGEPGFDDLKAGKANFFPKDIFLDEKLKRWRDMFLSCLVYQYENVYSKEGLKDPYIIQQSSNSYREQFDSYAKFRNACMAPKGKMAVALADPEGTALNEIITAYKDWNELQGGGKRLTAQELRKRIEDDFGAPTNGKMFKGVILFDSEDKREEWCRENITQT